MISQTLITVYFVVGILCILLPVLALVIWKGKSGAALSPAFVGAGMFVLFALIIEGALNNFILSSGFGAAIGGNIWLYALFGGLMAGIFEETGRLAGYKLFLRRHYRPETAVTYGLGHGGIECILIVGVTLLGYGINALAIKNGTVSLDAAASQELYAMLVAASEAPFTSLWALLERFSALILQVSLSVIMFKAVSVPGKLWLYPVAILIHAFVDGVAVILAAAATSLVIIEGVILIMSLAAAYVAVKMYRNMKKTMPGESVPYGE